MENRSITAAIVVVYNKRCADSQTCTGLSAGENPVSRVLVYDNSTTNVVEENRAFCERHGWMYLGGTGNNGLSKAYNACMDALNGETGVVCLFDDDTTVDGAYFESLNRGLAQSDAELLVPVIFSGGSLISPCIRQPDYRCRLFDSEQALRAYTGSELTAINSGMAIDLSVFADYRYDEHVFLDGIDHTFVEDQKKLGRKIYILDYRCNHEFSGMEKPPMKSAMVRFRIFAKDFKYILRDKKSAYFLLAGRRALHLTVQYRSLSFLTELAKIAFKSK